MSDKIMDHKLDKSKVNKAKIYDISNFRLESGNINSYKNNLVSELRENFEVSNIEELISNISDINKTGATKANSFGTSLTGLENEIQTKLNEARALKAKLEEEAQAKREAAQAQRP